MGTFEGRQLGLLLLSGTLASCFFYDSRQLLDELAAHDPGEGVAWVVGFAGRPPTLETSSKQLGKAHLVGKHVVVRAMNDAVEFDALEELEKSRRKP